jgi:hypothetical protein
MKGRPVAAKRSPAANLHYPSPAILALTEFHSTPRRAERQFSGTIFADLFGNAHTFTAKTAED